ncbi:hypothetical protein C8R45DRAFT_360563 [Mycena sanguinolenta]|nr:hypothetical protein C8R45DRAFT_360563 [Mycena sanguinolenta]
MYPPERRTRPSTRTSTTLQNNVVCPRVRAYRSGCDGMGGMGVACARGVLMKKSGSLRARARQDAAVVEAHANGASSPSRGCKKQRRVGTKTSPIPEFTRKQPANGSGCYSSLPTSTSARWRIAPAPDARAQQSRVNPNSNWDGRGMRACSRGVDEKILNLDAALVGDWKRSSAHAWTSPRRSFGSEYTGKRRAAGRGRGCGHEW